MCTILHSSEGEEVGGLGGGVEVVSHDHSTVPLGTNLKCQQKDRSYPKIMVMISPCPVDVGGPW